MLVDVCMCMFMCCVCLCVVYVSRCLCVTLCVDVFMYWSVYLSMHVCVV